MIHITIDDRERDLIATCMEIGCPKDTVASVQRLVLGDIHVRGAVMDVLVERKRHDDLLQSVFDGRLGEQSARLRAWGGAAPDRWVVLVVEGRPDADHPRAALFVKMLLSVGLRHRAEPRSLVVRTADLRETAVLLFTLAKTIAQLADHDPASPSDPVPPPRRCVGDVFLRQLCCVSGVSIQRARRVQARFPGWRALLAAAERDADDLRRILAAEMKHRPAAERLVALLLSPPVPPGSQDDGARSADPPARARGRPKAVPRSARATGRKRPAECAPPRGKPPQCPRFFRPDPGDGSDAGTLGALGVDATIPPNDGADHPDGVHASDR